MSFSKYCLLAYITCFVFNVNLLAQNADITALRRINLAGNSALDLPMKVVSKTEGYIGVAIPVSILIASYAKHDKYLFQKGINMGLALAASSASTFILKRVVNRQRPAYTYPDIQAYEPDRYYSFPSGHTSNAFCTATSLSLNFKKWYVVVPSYAWAVAVGYSRMHLGMHYPSDVLCGAVLGAGSAYATYKVNKMLKAKYYKKYSEK